MAPTSSSTTLYRGPQDWYAFQSKFETRAEKQGLWKYLDPARSFRWPQRPTTPVLSDFGDTHAGRQSYRGVLSAYNKLCEEYKAFEDQFADLAQWTLDSVTPEVQLTQLHPDEDLQTWYQKLSTDGKMYEAEWRDSIEKEYIDCMNEVGKWANKIDQWIMKWEQIMAKGQRHRLTDTLDAVYWFDDFCTALRPYMEEWIPDFERTHHLDVYEGMITYHTVAAKARIHWSSVYACRGRPAEPRGRDEQQGTEDGQSDIEPRRGRNRRKGTHRGRRDGSSSARENDPPNGGSGKRKRADTSAGRCRACLSDQHALPECFYAFPERAYKGFRFPAKGLVEWHLERNPAVQAGIERLRKRKRGAST